MGGDDLLLFIPDPELGLLLPVLGFPQTMRGGREWRGFLESASSKAVVRANLPSPYSEDTVPVSSISGSSGIVLVLFGADPHEHLFQRLAELLPLAGQALEREQQLRVSNAQLEHMRGEVRSARLLSTALDQLRRELEQALETAGRETAVAETAKKDVLKANVELAIARDQALAASRSKGSFLANMSHELRTPLTAIIGYSEMLQEDIADEGAQKDLQRIHDAGRHLLTLVSDILDMAKIEAGHVELFAEPFTAEEIINEAVEIATPQMAGGGNTCVVETAQGIPPLFTDQSKLRQILLNLLSNAAKFTTGGTVTVAAGYSKSTGMINFTVADTGIGMSAEAMPRLFTEFSQLNDSSTKTVPGTGLGLAISKRLCKLLGGEIAVESKLGEGSTFQVAIPPRMHGEKLKLTP